MILFCYRYLQSIGKYIFGSREDDTNKSIIQLIEHVGNTPENCEKLAKNYFPFPRFEDLMALGIPESRLLELKTKCCNYTNTKQHGNMVVLPRRDVIHRIEIEPESIKTDCKITKVEIFLNDEVVSIDYYKNVERVVQVIDLPLVVLPFMSASVRIEATHPVKIKIFVADLPKEELDRQRCAMDIHYWKKCVFHGFIARIKECLETYHQELQGPYVGCNDQCSHREKLLS